MPEALVEGRDAGSESKGEGTAYYLVSASGIVSACRRATAWCCSLQATTLQLRYRRSSTRGG